MKQRPSLHSQKFTQRLVTAAGLSLALGVTVLPAWLPAQDRGAASAQPTTKPSGAEGPKADARPTGDQDPKPRRAPSATDILKELTSRGNAPIRVVAPTRPGTRERTTIAPEALPKNAVAIPDRKLLPDGSRLVDRPGRLVAEGRVFVFAFESRGRGTPEPPMRLLPNRMLEDMEIKSRGGTVPIVFVISGEVTEYHGVNYLLIQKLLIRPDLGNLR